MYTNPINVIDILEFYLRQQLKFLKGWYTNMLNELQEFQEYTMPMEAFADKSALRLKYVTFIKKPLSGLERAMTIIARWYIYKNGKTKKDFNENNVKELLKAWCGFEYEKSIPEAELLKGWLNRYIRQLFLKKALEECYEKLNSTTVDAAQKIIITDILVNICPHDDVTVLAENNTKLKKAYKCLPDTKNIKTVKDELSKIIHTIDTLETLQKRRKTFNQDLFSSKYNETNDYKAITYERIIANAYYLGKLEQYYLSCDINPFESNLIEKHTPKKATKKLQVSDKDLLLRTTALYLLQKKQTDQNSVYFNQTDLANWLKDKAAPSKFELEKYKLSDSGEHVFNQIPVARNATKLKIHNEWIKHFKLVKACDIDKPENRELIFYSDAGCSTYLLYNEKYQEL